MEVARVLLVDDNPIFLRAVSALLANKPGIEIAGCLTSGEEALKLIPSIQPTLILLDLRMPGIDGLEVARRLKADPECPRIAIVSASCEDEHRTAAKAAGADDFICKDKLTSELRRLVADLHKNNGNAA